MKKARLILLVALFCLIQTPFITAQQITFSKVLSLDLVPLYSSDAIETFENGFFIAGEAEFGYAMLVKTDSAGTILWTKLYDCGFGNSIFYKMCRTKDSCYVLVGNTVTASGGNTNEFILKITKAGNILWSTAIEGQHNMIAVSVQQTLDAGYIISGDDKTSNESESRAFVTKLDSVGSHQWTKEYHSTANIVTGNCVRQASDSSIYLTGFAGDCATWDCAGNAYLLKLGNSGNLIWSKEYNRGTTTYIQGQSLYLLNNAILDHTNVGLFKIDTSGNVLWAKNYNDQDEMDYFNSFPDLSSTHDSCYSFLQGWEFDSYHIKVDSMGIMKSKSYPIMDARNSFETSDSGTFMIGNGPFPAVRRSYLVNEIALIKTDTVDTGQNCFSKFHYVGEASDSLYSYNYNFTVNSAGVVHTINPSVVEILIMSEDRCIGGGGGIKELNDSFEVEVFPNPTSASIVVQSNHAIDQYELNDLSGKTILKNEIKAVSHSIDLSIVNSGFYILTIHQKGKVVHRKVIKE